jgi:hypothetical protein
METPKDKLEDKETLDKIRNFQGSFAEFKDMMDRKAGKNTNAYDSPVYQGYGVVNIPKRNMVKNFSTFIKEEYVAYGFTGPSSSDYASSGVTFSNPYQGYSGYNMTAVASVLDDATQKAIKEAQVYSDDDDENHTKEGYLQEYKKLVGSKLAEAFTAHGIDSSLAVLEDLNQ